MARMLRAGCIASDDDADGYVFITREAAVILAFIGTYYSINSMDPRKVRNLYERNAWEFMKLSAKEYLDYLCRQDGWDRKLTKKLMEEVPDSSIDGTVADYLKYCYGFLELSYPALQLIYDMSVPGFRDLHLSDYENEQMRRNSVLVTLLWQMMVIGPGI